jgi:hypothetical protein
MTGWRRTGRWIWAAPRVKLIALSLAALAATHGLGSAATYYVATNGSDSASGNITHPFATFTQARNTLRPLVPIAGGATVYVRGGTYCVTNALALTSADSGKSVSEPIVWRSYPGETVDWIGGLPLTNWQTWHTNILCVNASTQGVYNAFRTLLFNAQRQILARTPNYNPADPTGFYSSFDAMATGTSGSFTYASGDLPNVSTWANPTLGQVFWFCTSNHGNRVSPITGLTASTRTIQITSDQVPAAGDRYYIQNVFEELDTTNEFYVNPSTHFVYWFAPSAPGTTPAYAVIVTNLVTLASGTSNVWFQGFTFEGACSIAITMTNAVNCMVSACTIRNIGDYYQEIGAGYGVWVNGGSNNGVATNTIYSIGADGVLCDGGRARTLTCSSNYAAYNTITQVGVVKKAVAGVRLKGTGNRASHNLIFNCPRWGVGCVDGYFPVVAETVEYNHIHDVCQETEDVGPIYFYAEPEWISYRGSIVRYNYIHNCIGYGAGDGTSSRSKTNFTQCKGIYIDALGNGVDIYGNIVDQIACGDILINGGRDNLIHNNIFLQTTNWELCFHCYATNDSEWLAVSNGMVSGYYSVQGQSVWASVRGMNVAPTNIFAEGLTAGGNTFGTNILVYHPRGHNGAYNYIYAGSAGSNYAKSNFWDFNCVYVYGGTISTLIQLPTSYFTWGSTWQALGEDVHSISADPQFRLSAVGDYYVRNTDVLALGFQQIPASQIGPTNLFTLPAPP